MARPKTSKTLEQRLMEARAESTFHDPKLKYFPIESTRRLVTSKAIEKEFKKFEIELSRLKEAEEEEDNDEGDDNYDDEEDEEEGSLDKADDDQESSKAFYLKFAGYDQEKLEKLAQWVDKNAHTTFAIAVASGFSPLNLLPYMATFEAGGFTDRDLERMDDLEKLKFRGDPASLERFCEQRWRFLAPVFSTEQYDYDLPSDCLFPFQKDDSKSRKGAFGLVSKVLVHEEHQRHPGIQSVCVNAHVSTKKAEDL